LTILPWQCLENAYIPYIKRQGILTTLKITYRMPTPEAWRRRLVDAKSAPGINAQSLATQRCISPLAELGREKHARRAQGLQLAPRRSGPLRPPKTPCCRAPPSARLGRRISAVKTTL